MPHCSRNDASRTPPSTTAATHPRARIALASRSPKQQTPFASMLDHTDFDGDNDLDLFVGFKKDIPNRLYRNDGGTFVEVGSQAGIADLTATRGTGWGDGRSLALILGYLSISAVFAGGIAFPLFERLHRWTQGNAPVLSKAAAPVAAPAGLGEWVSGLVPYNIFKAAADGALLPLIVISIAFGITLARMPSSRRDVLLLWLEAIRDAFTRLIDAVLQTAPVGVFCLAVSLPAAMELGDAGALFGYIVGLSLISAAFMIFVLYPSVATFSSVPFEVFVRSAIPAQALAFTSRSSLAALPVTLQAVREGLGIPEEVSSFYFPFATSIFGVGGCMAQMVGICFLATFYGVPLSWTQLAGIAVSAAAVSLTVPGIPGGAIIVMTPILASAGIPLGGMAMLLAVDTIPDMFRTTANVTGWLSAGAILSSISLKITSDVPSRDQAERDPIS
jgi:Na+/H+-dicarboxylate symporter